MYFRDKIFLHASKDLGGDQGAPGDIVHGDRVGRLADSKKRMIHTAQVDGVQEKLPFGDFCFLNPVPVEITMIFLERHVFETNPLAQVPLGSQERNTCLRSQTGPSAEVLNAADTQIRSLSPLAESQSDPVTPMEQHGSSTSAIHHSSQVSVNDFGDATSCDLGRNTDLGRSNATAPGLKTTSSSNTSASSFTSSMGAPVRHARLSWGNTVGAGTKSTEKYIDIHHHHHYHYIRGLAEDYRLGPTPMTTNLDQ